MKKNPELKMYIRNLLVETLPSSQRTNRLLDKLEVSESDRFTVLQLLLSRKMKNLIHNKNEDEAILWKQSFHERLEHMLTDKYGHVMCILNLQPMIRTVIISVDSSIEEKEVAGRLQESFDRLSSDLVEVYGTTVIGCYGQLTDDFFSIGTSYKTAREIQEFHYIIGLGKCAFYNDGLREQEFSLVEYKHIHLFEEMVQKEEWTSLEELLEVIKSGILIKKIPFYGVKFPTSKYHFFMYPLEKIHIRRMRIKILREEYFVNGVFVGCSSVKVE